MPPPPCRLLAQADTPITLLPLPAPSSLLPAPHSQFHPESWNPMWSVGTILNGLLSFMYDSQPTTGSITATPAERQRLARESLGFNMKNPNFRKLFPEWVEEHARRSEESAKQAAAGGGGGGAQPEAQAAAAAAAGPGSGGGGGAGGGQSSLITVCVVVLVLAIAFVPLVNSRPCLLSSWWGGGTGSKFSPHF